MTELEKLARVLAKEHGFEPDEIEMVWDEQPETAAVFLESARTVLKHLHDNVSEGMVEAAWTAYPDPNDQAPVVHSNALKAAFQAAIASILEEKA